MPAISIITPIYNAESTLSACVRSILAQTFRDWELFLVDDGSSDRSLLVCQQLAAQEQRINVLSQDHQGVSAARNLALRFITTPYVCFVDADDTIEPDYLEKLYRLRHFDMVICGYSIDHLATDGAITRQEWRSPVEFALALPAGRSELEPLFVAGMININCNKLLHTEIIRERGIRYPDVPVEEDYLFMVDYLGHCRSIATIEKPLYHWKRREGQMTGVSSIPDNLVEIYNEAHSKTEAFFNNAKTAARVMYNSYYFLALKYFIGMTSGNDRRLALNKMFENPWVRLSFGAHRPESAGEFVMLSLLRMRCYRLFFFLHRRLSR